MAKRLKWLLLDWVWGRVIPLPAAPDASATRYVKEMRRTQQIGMLLGLKRLPALSLLADKK